MESQRIFCDGIKKSRDPVLQPRVSRPENNLFPEEEVNITIKAWTNREQMERAIKWAANISDNKINLTLIGRVYYEFTFAPAVHQTGIILDLRKTTLYSDDMPPASYSAVGREHYVANLKTYNPDRISDGVRLEGTIPAGDLILIRDQVGTGPID